ncbi:MAG: response regulator, partial [Planctomycetota bacterium]
SEFIHLVARLCPCDAASVAIFHPERDCFELVAVYGPHLPALIRPGVTIPSRETPMSEAWHTGEVYSDPDGHESRYPRPRVVARAGIASSLYIPVGEPRRALLIVGHQLAHRFGAEEVALYRSFVPFLEIALRNAELVGKIRAAYRELDATQERLVRSERLRALGELAAGVAHDVGNALAIVASHAELMARRAPDTETREMVASCLESVREGARAVKNVLDMARGETPQRGARLQYDIESIAREAVLFTAPRWKAAGQTIDLEALLPVPAASGDRGEVRDAIVNLLLNALDATPRGGAISIATCVVEQSLVLAVEDAGAGVPAELRERVFEPFFTTKGPSHVGLGLAQVARVARQLGGSVRVNEAGLGGARFELRLPLKEIGSGPHELPKVEKPAPPSCAVEVLLVEDEVALRSALSALLRLRGHEVVTAGDVNEALAILATRPTIRVVVTDLGLPGRSGWELVDEIHARTPSLPVIVLSGLGVLTDPEQAKERGVAAVLSKPTSEQDLAATIEHLVH